MFIIPKGGFKLNISFLFRFRLQIIRRKKIACFKIESVLGEQYILCQLVYEKKRRMKNLPFYRNEKKKYLLERRHKIYSPNKKEM